MKIHQNTTNTITCNSSMVKCVHRVPKDTMHTPAIHLGPRRHSRLSQAIKSFGDSPVLVRGSFIHSQKRQARIGSVSNTFVTQVEALIISAESMHLLHALQIMFCPCKKQPIWATVRSCDVSRKTLPVKPRAGENSLRANPLNPSHQGSNGGVCLWRSKPLRVGEQKVTAPFACHRFVNGLLTVC